MQNKKRAVLFLLTALVSASAYAAEIGVWIRFGINDKTPTAWDGTVTVTPGKVTQISGWRFQQRDEVNGTTGWRAATRSLSVRRSNNPKKGGTKAKENNATPMADNGVMLVLEDVTEDSIMKVKTIQGEFEVKVSEMPYGNPVARLNGKVEVERVAATKPLTSQRTDDDFPAITVTPDGTIHVAYLSFTPGIDRDERAKSWDKEPADFSFLNRPTGGDQLWLSINQGGKWNTPLPVTPGQGDLYKCSLAVDGKGNVHIFWSEQKEGNFDIWERALHKGALAEAQRISTDKGNDINPVATTDKQGRVWVAWQGARSGAFRILARRQTDSGWAEEMTVSTLKGNCWAPAIAAAQDGRVALVFDTYDRGDYDIWMREYDASAKPGQPRPVANSDEYEARASATYDLDGRLWIAYEKSGQTWGKNFGAYDRSGIGLYRNRQIGLAIFHQDKFLEPEKSFLTALPGATGRRARNLPVRRPEPDATTRKAGEEAQSQGPQTFNNMARIACDAKNHIWLFCRSRQGQFQTPIGSVWLDYATYYDGKNWINAVLLPHSDNLLYNLPAVAAHPAGGVIVAHSSDHRQDRHVIRSGPGGNASLDADKDPFDNDIYVSRMELPAPRAAHALKTAGQSPSPDAQPTQKMAKEKQEVEGIRAYRANIDGKNLQILRGEFHRHTEISGDGGGDGPLDDMWRYGLDAASMDWIGNGDHDNGGGREYSWWLTQKTTDAHHIPGHFDPLFSYERSVRYPEGHRNVVFVQRGVRTLPRLPISARDSKDHAPDTQLLYKYLRQFDGVCASHTSGTSMGTDWRDNDPIVEPMVEIYQGCRQNYERPGAPRCPTENDSIGGWEPLGFVNLALLKGYRFSFQASSDHGSTHISYCLVYAEVPTREAIHKAMKARHTYASTDNIIADYRCSTDGREHMMGDEFTVSQPPKLTCKLMGTAPFKKVTLVKDDVEIYSIQPNQADVQLTWTDPKPEPGKTSYYYLRGEQTDEELVWISPMWIKFQPK